MAIKEKSYRVVVGELSSSAYEEWGVLRSENSIETWFNEAGLIHRDDGPAITVRSLITGKAVGECWYKLGMRHRDGDEPAWTLRRTFELEARWYKNGELHREDAPALVEVREGRFPSTIAKEEWRRSGRLHRIGGPALCQVFPETGVIFEEKWYVDGVNHRIDGPAIIGRDHDTGVATTEFWYRGGKLSRESGPTYIERDRITGELTSSRFYIDDDDAPSP